MLILWYNSEIMFIPSVSIPPASFGPICFATGLCSDSPATGIMSIVKYLGFIILPAIKTIFIGVAVFYLARYATMMILFGEDESSQKEGRKAIEKAIQGMAVMGIAAFLVDTVAPSVAGSALLDATPFTAAINGVVNFIMMVTGVFLVFVISLSGFRIIVLQGNESEIEKQKKSFFNGLLGVVLLLVSRVAVQAILPTGAPSDLVLEAGGIIRFLLDIIAVLAVIAVIASGVLFLVSLHSDSMRQRAKRILVSTAIILVIVVCSHILVSTFLPAGALPSTL